MSGPVRTEDVATDAAERGPERCAVEISASRETEVGGHRVRRALPQRTRRTVGAWCFADHMGPAQVTEDTGMSIGPHPHIGLQTVTWLLAGEALHRDSVGSEQLVRPGQLNLMTAGHGVSHAEEGTGRYRGEAHGIQLWVAQPEATRHGPPAFEHHASLPQADVDGGGVATVLVGEFGGAASTARRDTDHMGVDLALPAGSGAVVPLRPDYEHAVVVLSGAVEADGAVVTPGSLAYLGLGRDELSLRTTEPTRLMLLGGVPFESRVFMWWNFVARSREEVDAAYADWQAESGRFGETGSGLGRIPAPRPPWWREGR